jgi:LCP family protein required for cell wall assembly
MLEKEVITEKKKIGFGFLTLITIATIVVVIAGIVFVMRMMGKSNIYATVAGTEMLDLGEPVTEDEELEDNQILYNGKKYALNEDLITILVMGIDKETVYDIGGQSWSADENGEYAGGQADALFLMLINPHDENVYVIAINRNSMVDVDVFDEEGNYEGRYIKQVALQHGYGDGKEESCERQVKTVSRMFHNVPINDYVAISMDAIPELNDLLGGIEVEVLDDIVYPEYDMNLHQGETVTLYGEQAYWYVRLRNEAVFNSNELRLQRQKQYLTTFAAKAKKEASLDIRVAVNLYQTAQKYMVTDIDLTSFTYLATEALGYDFDVENMYSLEGETVQGNNFEEFYVDDEALQQLIVDLFYEPVEEN